MRLKKKIKDVTKQVGLRVLGFAYKDYRGNQVTLEDEHDLTFIGLVSLMDSTTY